MGEPAEAKKGKGWDGEDNESLINERMFLNASIYNFWQLLTIFTPNFKFESGT